MNEHENIIYVESDVLTTDDIKRLNLQKFLENYDF